MGHKSEQTKDFLSQYYIQLNNKYYAVNADINIYVKVN